MNIPTHPLTIKTSTGAPFTFNPAEVEEFIKNNQKIEMIKLVRIITGDSLMQSKKLVDNSCDILQGFFGPITINREKMWEVLLSLPCFHDQRQALNNELLDQIKQVLLSNPTNPINALQGVLNRFRPIFNKQIEA